MFDIGKQKEQEIDNIVSILKQIDLPSILLLTRDANTLLMRQQAEEERKTTKTGTTETVETSTTSPS